MTAGGGAIVQAATEVFNGKFDDNFPLVVWADRVRHTVEHERE